MKLVGVKSLKCGGEKNVAAYLGGIVKEVVDCAVGRVPLLDWEEGGQ